MIRLSNKIVSALVAAAAIAGTLTLLPMMSGQVSASGATGKADRLDPRPAVAVAVAVRPAAPMVDCAAQSWPNFDAACIKDARQVQGQARTVRVVGTERR